MKVEEGSSVIESGTKPRVLIKSIVGVARGVKWKKDPFANSSVPVVLDFIARNDNKYLIRSKEGRFLCAKPRDSGVVFCKKENDPNTLWTIEKRPKDSGVALKTKGGRCLRMTSKDKKKKTKGYYLNTKKCAKKTDHKWKIRKLEKPPEDKPKDKDETAQKKQEKTSVSASSKEKEIDKPEEYSDYEDLLMHRSISNSSEDSSSDGGPSKLFKDKKQQSPPGAGVQPKSPLGPSGGPRDAQAGPSLGSSGMPQPMKSQAKPSTGGSRKVPSAPQMPQDKSRPSAKRQADFNDEPSPGLLGSQDAQTDPSKDVSGMPLPMKPTKTPSTIGPKKEPSSFSPLRPQDAPAAVDLSSDSPQSPEQGLQPQKGKPSKGTPSKNWPFSLDGDFEEISDLKDLGPTLADEKISNLTLDDLKKSGPAKTIKDLLKKVSPQDESSSSSETGPTRSLKTPSTKLSLQPFSLSRPKKRKPSIPLTEPLMPEPQTRAKSEPAKDPSPPAQPPCQTSTNIECKKKEGKRSALSPDEKDFQMKNPPGKCEDIGLTGDVLLDKLESAVSKRLRNPMKFGR